MLVATSAGQVLRLETDDTLTSLGTFADGVQGGIARVGGFLLAATGAGTLASMNRFDGKVAPLRAHGLGEVAAIATENGQIRLIAGPGPQVFNYDPVADPLAHVDGLLGFYERVTDAASGTLAQVTFTGTGGDE